MQFALESYLIPFEDVFPQDMAIATEIAQRPHIFEMIGRGISALINMFGPLIVAIGRAIAKLKGSRVEEYDDYEEEIREGPNEWAADNYHKLDRICSSAVSIKNDLMNLIVVIEDPSSGSTEFVKGRHGSLSERDAFGSIENSQVWENLQNFADRTKEFNKLPDEKRWLKKSEMDRVVDFLERERDAATQLQARLKKFYDKYKSGTSAIDDANVKALPKLTKAITEYTQTSMTFVKTVQLFHILSED